MIRRRLAMICQRCSCHGKDAEILQEQLGDTRWHENQQIYIAVWMCLLSVYVFFLMFFKGVFFLKDF